MLATFYTILKRLQFQENVTDDIFQSLQKCENFMKYVFFVINLHKIELLSFYTLECELKLIK